jgi:hypothetical protein
MVKKSNVVVVAKVRDEGDASNWNQFVGKSCDDKPLGSAVIAILEQYLLKCRNDILIYCPWRFEAREEWEK